MIGNISELLEILEEVEKLYNIIVNLRNKTKLELNKKKINYNKERISFELIDLSGIHDRLISLIIKIHYNYTELFSPEGLLRNNINLKTKILTVYLAGICSMVKKDFYHGTTTTFKRVTGIEANYQYYKLLEEAFSYEGILPDDWDHKKPHRYKDVIINESGIPADLVSNTIKFFKISWKYIKGTNIKEKKEFIEKLKNENFLSYKYQYRDLVELKKLYQKVKDYPTKVLTIITQLEEIYYYIEENNFDKLDLKKNYFYKKASSDLKFDILTIIPNKNILVKLYEEMLNKVTLYKFKRILNNKPRELNISLPNGRRITNKQYSNYMYGKHKLIGVEYTVLPDTSLELEEIFTYKLNKIIYIGDNHYLYVSNREFNIEKGIEKYISLPIYYKKQRKYIWYDKIPQGRPTIVDGKKIEPKYKFYWNMKVNYYWNSDEKRYKLYIKIPILRIYDENYKNEKVCLNCSASNKRVIDFFDRNGYLIKENIIFSLDNLSSKKIKISISINNNKIIDSKEIVLQDIYLFDKFTKQNYHEGTYEVTTGNLLLFIDKTLMTDFNLNNYFKYKKDFQYYEVYNINLITSNQVKIGERKWQFKEICELYFRKIFSNRITNFDEYSTNIIYNLGDINLEIVTNLNEREIKKVLILIEKDRRVKEFPLLNISYRKKDKIIFNSSILENEFRNCDTYIGEWYISLFYLGKRFHTVNYKVIPNIIYRTEKELYKEGEEIKVLLKSDLPCFYDPKYNKLETVKIIKMGKACLKKDNNCYIAQTIQENITIDNLGIDKKIKITPKVWGIRIFDISTNKYSALNSVYIGSFDEIKQKQLVIITEVNNDVILKVNNYEEKIYLKQKENFLDIKKYYKYFNEVTKITVYNNGESLHLNIKWDTFVKKIEYFIEGYILNAKYKLEGPSVNDFEIILFTEEKGKIESFSIKEQSFSIIKNIEINLLQIDSHIIYIYFVRKDTNYREEFKIDLSKIKSKIKNDDRFLIINLIQERYLKDININQNIFEKYTIDMLEKDIQKYVKIAKKFAKHELLLEGAIRYDQESNKSNYSRRI